LLLISHEFLPGQATARLTNFDRIIGIDPSFPMIRAARQESTWPKERINFVQGDAENLGGILADNSVDMVVSGLSRQYP
jgi:ubiquinone/menaquinone biosynthesis C-methylase UbiE